MNCRVSSKGAFRRWFSSIQTANPCVFCRSRNIHDKMPTVILCKTSSRQLAWAEWFMPIPLSLASTFSPLITYCNPVSREKYVALNGGSAMLNVPCSDFGSAKVPLTSKDWITTRASVFSSELTWKVLKLMRHCIGFFDAYHEQLSRCDLKKTLLSYRYRWSLSSAQKIPIKQITIPFLWFSRALIYETRDRLRRI